MQTRLDTDSYELWLIALGVTTLHGLLLLGSVLSASTPPRLAAQNVSMEVMLTHTQPVTNTIPTRPSPALKVTPHATTQPSARDSTSTVAAIKPETVPTPTSGVATGAAEANGHLNTAAALTLPRSEGSGLNNPAPIYPRLSRRLNEQGQVVIRVWVTADGEPQQAEVKSSSGYDRLDQEALRTVLRWHFVPGQRFGIAQAMWFNVPVHFVLD